MRLSHTIFGPWSFTISHNLSQRKNYPYFRENGWNVIVMSLEMQPVDFRLNRTYPTVPAVMIYGSDDDRYSDM